MNYADIKDDLWFDLAISKAGFEKDKRPFDDFPEEFVDTFGIEYSLLNSEGELRTLVGDCTCYFYDVESYDPDDPMDFLSLFDAHNQDELEIAKYILKNYYDEDVCDYHSIVTVPFLRIREPYNSGDLKGYLLKSMLRISEQSFRRPVHFIAYLLEKEEDDASFTSCEDIVVEELGCGCRIAIYDKFKITKEEIS